jgi:hypothetical protein
MPELKQGIADGFRDGRLPELLQDALVKLLDKDYASARECGRAFE